MDVEAANAPKPIAPPEILTDEAASALYSAKVETWGESVSRAWGRICRTLAGQGVSVECMPLRASAAIR